MLLCHPAAALKHLKITICKKGMDNKMNKILNKVFAGITFLLLAGLFCVKWTGPGLHAVLGMVLSIMMAVHFSRKRRCMYAVPERMSVINGLLLAALAAMFFSGIWIHVFPELLWLKIVHKLSGTVFIIGMTGHILQHRKLRKEGTKDVS